MAFTIPNLNTRFAKPIVCPKTGEHVSAETLYNRCCADLGRVVTDHIGDLIFDNLQYGTPMGEVEVDEMCKAIYAWSDGIYAHIKEVMRPKKARFWHWHNGSAVRLTVHQGDTITHREHYDNGEGFTSTSHSWEFDGKRVHMAWATDATDCDGRMQRSGSASCDYDDLARHHVDEDHHRYPLWDHTNGGQRDYSAEAMGY